MQSNGVQFYLGIYETEIEAAQAYEKKVKESGGHARLVNYIFPFTDISVSVIILVHSLYVLHIENCFRRSTI